MARIILFFVLALVFGTTQALALTPEKRIYSSGSWAVYTMPLVIANKHGEGVLIIDAPLCAAQVGSKNSAFLRIVFVFEGMNVVQVAAPSWNFGRKRGAVELKAAPSLVFVDAFYAEAFIEKISGGKPAKQVEVILEAIAQNEDQRIEVKDYINRSLVSFPVNGMAAALSRAKKCSQSYL